jgi:hypothetical protein
MFTSRYYSEVHNNKSLPKLYMFSKNYYHTEFHDVAVISAIVTCTSEVRTATELVLLMVKN